MMYILFLGSTDGTTRKLKVTKLIEGHEYNFKVYAINEIGESDPCASTEPIKAKLPFGTFFIFLNSDKAINTMQSPAKLSIYCIKYMFPLFFFQIHQDHQLM